LEIIIVKKLFGGMLPFTNLELDYLANLLPHVGPKLASTSQYSCPSSVPQPITFTAYVTGVFSLLGGFGAKTIHLKLFA
jgi:hypothetical protein